MREELLGYLLNALEPFERAHAEEELATNPQSQRELAILSRGLEPLAAGRGDYEPPRGLAERTCEFVLSRDQVELPQHARSPRRSHSSASYSGGPLMHPAIEPAAPRSHWSVADFVVAVGILVAATMVFLPAVNHSRYMARLTSCSENLRELGLALSQYSSLHQETFPELPTSGPLATPGAYAARLHEVGLLSNPRKVLCPASDLAEHAGEFHIPSIAEVKAADGEQLAKLQNTMGGSYGYNLGYLSDRGYEPTRNLHRSNFALMADAPRTGKNGRPAGPHGALGRNVLFEDGNVRFMTTSTARGHEDNIYLNDRGRIAPGLHRDDAVIAPSWVKPFAAPAAVESLQ